MKNVRPIVIKIGETVVHPEALGRVLAEVGASETASSKFLGTHGTDGQTLIEFAGRICYESYEPGLNPNVTRIREDPADYFRNIVSRGDGSILEHSAVSFAICHVSRITTHELVRHRVGTAVSQESLRYVRPPEIRFWIPDELNPEQRKAMEKAVAAAEKAYRELEAQVPWEKMTMDQKKRLTSAIRRILPAGLATNLIWTANHRTLRWVIEMRTDPPPKSRFEWSSIRLRRFASGTTHTCTATFSPRTFRTGRNRTVPNFDPRSDAPENELTKDARRCDR